jgi:hypothetical protein
LDYQAWRVGIGLINVQLAFFTAGGFQEPFRIEGLPSFGEYRVGEGSLPIC